ncbi:hypothetical protein ACFVGY_08285 [Streptomyces sp. NPDC127106]|uniref:hypothetical protein n=1 Tax=Streptomyces sp. NPDC127106 TaxID=3345360 RepID=UPI00362CA9AF
MQQPEPPRRWLGKFLSHPGWAGIGGIVGVIGLAVAIAVSVSDGDQPETPPRPATSTPGPATPPPPANHAKRSITGSWSATGGDITVTVKEVEKTPVRALRLHVRAVNHSSSGRVLQLFGNFTAVDDQGQVYTPSNDPAFTQWPGNLAPHGSFTGVIETWDRAQPKATTLKVVFAKVQGVGATTPPGGLTITGIPLPA